MDPKIEKIKKIFTDARKLEVDFKNFFSPDLNGHYTNKKKERISCYLFDKKTLLYIARLAKYKNLVNTLHTIMTANIVITSDSTVYFKAGDKIVSSSCNIYKANMYISSGDTCVAAVVDDQVTAVVDNPDHISLGGGGNLKKIGSIYQSSCGLCVFNFDEKFKVFVMNKQQVLIIKFTDSTAYFSLPDTSGTIKFNVNTPYFRIYDGKKEYGTCLNNDDTLFIDDKNNMKFGEKDLKPEEATQILNNNHEPASSSWSTYALPVAATAATAAGLAYLYKKSKRKPKKSKSTRRQSSSSSSSSSSYRRPVRSSRKRKHLV